MSSADNAFHLISWKKGLVPRARLDVALAQARQSGASLESILVSAGDLDEAGRERVVRTRAKHAKSCSRCRGITFLLPRQEAATTPCEHCAGALLRSGTTHRLRSPSAYYATVDGDAEDTSSTVLEPPPFGARAASADATETVLEGTPAGTLPQELQPSAQPPPSDEDSTATVFMPADAPLLEAPPGYPPLQKSSESGVQRVPPPPQRVESENLVLAARMEPYRLDAAAGTIDGARSTGFDGTTFQFANVSIQQGAGLVADGTAPLMIMAAGVVRISGTVDLCGADGESGGGLPGSTVQVTAGGDLSVDGTILVDGGAGAAGCGGGAGGKILLQAMGNLMILGTLSAVGGVGGAGRSAEGGNGADGQVRLETGAGRIQVKGDIAPAPNLASLI